MKYLMIFLLSLTMSQGLAEGAKYKRKYFKHWIDENKDCRNTRAEVLIARSLTPVTFRVRKNGKKCTVDTGEWKDFYFDEVIRKASKIDIDHIVPLKHAWETGASKWNSKKREAFANDLENLVVTNLKYNRSKGAQTPLTWMPINRQYACKYLKKWMFIKEKYDLLISKEEREHFHLLDCLK